MLNIALSSVALMATAALASGGPGTARVVNMCTYPVHLSNVPAADGGYDEVDKVLNTNDVYEQKWTELSNAQGWSLKLSKSSSLESILQYEYTYHNDGIIWFDLSAVNGNPWDGNWEITSDGDSCTPKQQAYRFATDDAYGMQSCPDFSEVTVIVCSGNKDNAGGGPSDGGAPSTTGVPSLPVSIPAAPSAPAETTTAPAESSPSHVWSWSGGRPSGNVVDNKVQVPASSQSTTFAVAAKQTTAADQGYDVTVTHVNTAVVTAYVTAGRPAKRHEHHQRHPHRRHAA